MMVSSSSASLIPRLRMYWEHQPIFAVSPFSMWIRYRSLTEMSVLSPAQSKYSRLSRIPHTPP